MKKIVLLLLLAVFVLTAAPVFAASEKPENPEAVFVSIDVDKDGKVTRQELCAIFADKVGCEEKFIVYDKNGDGYIVKEEFVEAHR